MLTQKAKYGLKALGYLGRTYGKGPALISDISKKENIPLKFLENILLELKKHQFLLSKKGKGGGYMLAFEPVKISIVSVLRVIDGPIAMLPCISLNFYDKCNDCNEDTCTVNKVFLQVRDASLQILENKTVQDLM
jgi:Rrf2 family protein